MQAVEPAYEKITSLPQVLPGPPAPRSLARSWSEIIARLHARQHCALFLDFDGTLVDFQDRPADVRLPQRGRRILQRLAAHPCASVSIVSGRRMEDLVRLIGVEGIRYYGLHGAEEEGKKISITRPARIALATAKRQARARLAALPGIWVEDKDWSFAVHYRKALPATARAAGQILMTIVAPLRHSLHVLNGAKVWEVLPKGIRGKGARVHELLRGMPAGTVAIYIGDDDTDESAFAALQNQITIRVGRKHGTHAEFYALDPAGVLRFLARLDKELH